MIPANDSRFVHLRLHQNLLVLVLLMFMITGGTLSYGVVRQAQELTKLRADVRTAQRIIDNANNTSRANTEFMRCAFLIEPDVQKTPKVLDVCIKQANFPDPTVRQQRR